MISYLIPLFYFLIYGSATLAAAAPVVYATSKNMQLVAILFAPVSFTLAFVLVAGMLSRIGKAAIIQGTFERSLKDPIYGPRRLYGACWTALFYFSPLYFVVLSLPLLKKITFRLFGYSGPMDFTIYPDTWLRDLPCVLFEEGSYIANNATIRTNICLSDGKILVDRIKVGKKSIVGHIAMIALGTKIRDNVEIGLGVTVGIRSQFKKNANIGPCSGINHGAIIGENSIVGSRSYVGLKAIIGDNVVLPAGSNIPAGANIAKQDDVEKYYSSESTKLLNFKNNTLNVLNAVAPYGKVEG